MSLTSAHLTKTSRRISLTSHQYRWDPQKKQLLRDAWQSAMIDTVTVTGCLEAPGGTGYEQIPAPMCVVRSGSRGRSVIRNHLSNRLGRYGPFSS
jgi:hypothetical protein